MHRETEIRSLQKTAEQVLEISKQMGASQAEVVIESGEGFSVSVRVGEVETLEFHQGKSASVTLYLGKHCATASTTDLSSASLTSMVKMAHDIAQFTEEDPCYGLAEAHLMAKNPPDVDRYHPWSIAPDQAIEMAIAGEKKALAVDKRIINTDGVSVDTQESHHIYANTHGFYGEFSESSHALSCALVAKDGSDMQRDSDYTFACSADRLKTMEDVVESAARKVVSQLNPRKLPTQNTPIIFSSDISAHLIQSFFAAISGGNLYRHSSFLLDHLGKAIFPAWFNVMEDPHQKNTIGSTPFDGDGVLTQKKYFVEEGVLKSYALGSYSARRLGMHTTANAGGVFNVSLTSQKKEKVLSDMKALLKEMDKGVLVTSLLGSSVSILTGDYSRGAAGYWVEHGEIQYPVHEFTIASNLKEMFMAVQAIAMDIDTRKNIKTGSILLDNMMVAGE